MSTEAGRLAGKVALVTGASRRIGRATALELAREGATVVVHARSSREEIDAVVGEIEAAGGRAAAMLADVTDPAQVDRLMRDILTQFGRIDIVVNNAAIRAQKALTEMTTDEWRAVTGVILDGAFFVCRAALPSMVSGGSGVVINIGGMSGHAGAVNRAHVISAKAGIVGLTKAIAVEFGERGIRANCVVPGKIGGPRSHTAGAVPPPVGAAKPLIGREGECEEVAAMVLALCLPSAGFVTGQTVHVNGGQYLA